MVTMARETSVLATGWTTTEQAAKAVGLAPNSFRVWLNRHKEVERKFVGYSCVVRLDSVFEARRK
jgi:hypothetical protein